MELRIPEKPRWTVLANIVSPEQNLWIGTSWEFFHDPISAKACYERHIAAGNCPCMRPYHDNDREHLGAVHRMSNGEVRGASVTAKPACEASSAVGATSTVVLEGKETT